MTVTPHETKKHLLEYLPAIYQEPEESGAPSLLGRFLTAFERLLLDFPWSADDTDARGEGIVVDDAPLEKKVSDLHLYFSPKDTSEEFLPWLASWVALSFQPELNTRRRRRLLARIVPLYRIRGTRKYLQEVLTLCLDAIPTVNDAALPAMQIGTHSTVGDDTCLDGGPPHFFHVQLVAPKMNASDVAGQCRLATELIEFAKPAHTDYELEVISRQMQVGIYSTVGLDTILGPPAS